MNDLKPEEFATKLIADPNTCPNCGNADLDRDVCAVEAGEVWRRVTCVACSTKWCEHYTLDRVDLVENTTEHKSYTITYLIRSSDHEFHSESSTIEIPDQPSAAAAKRAAIAWIENNDPAHDDRIEPVIEILDVVQEEDGPDADASALV